MEQILNVERLEYLISVFGSFDENIRIIEREFDVQAIYRGTEIKLVGEPENVMLASKALEGLLGRKSRTGQRDDPRRNLRDFARQAGKGKDAWTEKSGRCDS